VAIRTGIRFDRSIVVAAPVAGVFAYVADFTRAHEWRAEVIESTMSTPRMAAGTVLHEVAVIAGRKVVTLSRVAAFEPGHRFTFEHVQGMLPVSGEYRVEPHADGAELTYTLEVRLSNLWALAGPYLRRSGKKMISASLANLRRRLEQTDAV
jgi:carbon monoxide dehydrogenase subunit G